MDGVAGRIGGDRTRGRRHLGEREHRLARIGEGVIRAGTGLRAAAVTAWGGSRVGPSVAGPREDGPAPFDRPRFCRIGSKGSTLGAVFLGCPGTVPGRPGPGGFTSGPVRLPQVVTAGQRG